MLIKEALSSTEPAKIRAGHGAAKGQVTKNLNKLKEGLLIESDEFLHDEINEKVVLKSAQKLLMISLSIYMQDIRKSEQQKLTMMQRKKVFKRKKNTL